MRLLKFRVTGFRSVEDSGWVDTGDVTALIGTNESGKTNLLLPLWKLKPAKDGAIEPVPDYPRARFTDIRNAKEKPAFISALFAVDDVLAADVVARTGATPDVASEVEITRRFDGSFVVSFPKAANKRVMPVAPVLAAMDQATTEIARLDAPKPEEVLHTSLLAAIVTARAEVDVVGATVGAQDLAHARDMLLTVDLEKAPKRSAIVPHFATLLDAITTMLADVTVIDPGQDQAVRTLMVDEMPTFVYYSNYGNLDSEIYLPHVIENMKREGLGSKETAKTRTLKVLFDFVGLKPQEILDLGREPRVNGREPTPQELHTITEQKRERSVLLQSAGTKLTREFKDWWKQGEYRFRFQADGDHFRIWVADDRRPEDIELEARSTGLQWFLSFYLIFLVERADEHADAILLLDEPGLSLHPLAQRDLSEFFENLAKTSSIIYTTHSPFLVDPDHLDRVKAVYVNDAGATVVSPDLRASQSREAQRRSIYPVHAALGLTVSDTLLQGCQVVVVEGQSDQLYLSAMKILLIAAGRITPARELVFVPAGGVRGAAAVIAITTGTEEALPFVLLDSDGPGVKLATQLRTGLYQGAPARVLLADVYAGGLAGAEIEDVVSVAIVSPEVRRLARGQDSDFDEVVQAGVPVVGQIETFAAASGVALELGWKVELAKRVKTKLLRQGAGAVSADTLERWGKLFDAFLTADLT
ncbi:AAA family ATPase [Gemmatimonas sp.]|uniref:ATP-dependent nuclease n=1 Tax=Gemmatimonas sp. TaxID=1962908 RepID=UPI00286DE479|nr:AAA family ATPase [Gemmatimonas sp.]